MEVGLVQGKSLSVDGSFVEANAATRLASIPSRQVPRGVQFSMESWCQVEVFRFSRLLWGSFERDVRKSPAAVLP